MTGFIATLTQMQRFALADTKAHAELVVVPMISLLLTNDNVRCALELGGCDFSSPSASASLQRAFGAALSSSLRKVCVFCVCVVVRMFTVGWRSLI